MTFPDGLPINNFTTEKSDEATTSNENTILIKIINIMFYGCVTALLICLCMRIKRFVNKKRKRASDNQIQTDIQSRPLPRINNLRELKVDEQVDDGLYMEHDNVYVEHSTDIQNSLVLEESLKDGKYYTLTKEKLFHPGNKGFRSVVVKKLKETADSHDKLAFINEYQMLKTLTHPNVMQLLDSPTVQESSTYFTVEFAELGTLRTYLRTVSLNEGHYVSCDIYQSIDKPTNKEDVISSKEILSFAWQVAKGMTYLVDKKIIHRNLCANKVLLTINKVCKITSADMEHLLDSKNIDLNLKNENVMLNVQWMALETLSGRNMTIDSNKWSYGVLLWELVSLGEPPYVGVLDQDLCELLQTGFRLEKPNGCSNELYNVMKSCWKEEPSQRPTFKSISKTVEKMLEDRSEYIQFDFVSAVDRRYNIYS